MDSVISNISNKSAHLIDKAVDLLNRGEVIAIPTETVYGLAADISQKEAIKKLFKIKNRPLTKPISLLIPDESYLTKYAKHIPAAAQLLAKKFWPGPLTIVLPKADNVPSNITANKFTVGLRVPNHPLTLSILAKLKKALAVPSANLYGGISPTTAVAVRTILQNYIPFIVDGGHCQEGIESTIIDFSQDPPAILRAGAISEQQILEALKIKHIPKFIISSHWQLRKPIYYLNTLKWRDWLIKKITTVSGPYALIVHDPAHCIIDIKLKIICLPNNPKEYSKLLYINLSKLQQDNNCQGIFIAKLPNQASWQALDGRLENLGRNI